MFKGIIKEEIVGKKRSCDIILQQIDDDYATYCVQYAGNGHYYKTFEEARDYIFDRWKILVPPSDAQ